LRIYSSVTVHTGMPLIGGNVFGVNSYTGLWLAHTAYGLPFAIYLMRNFFSALPRDLFESAYMDGASDLTVFRRLVLPLSVPAVAALAIFQFLWVWNDLLVALVFLGDAKLYPMTVQIQSLVSQVPPRDRDVAIVFQSFGLYPHMAVYGNMAFGLFLRKMPKAEIQRRVNEAAALLDNQELLKRKPRQLSRGQGQGLALGTGY